jgi:hypothetical protein
MIDWSAPARAKGVELRAPRGRAGGCAASTDHQSPSHELTWSQSGRWASLGTFGRRVPIGVLVGPPGSVVRRPSVFEATGRAVQPTSIARVTQPMLVAIAVSEWPPRRPRRSPHVQPAAGGKGRAAGTTGVRSRTVTTLGGGTVLGLSDDGLLASAQQSNVGSCPTLRFGRSSVIDSPGNCSDPLTRRSKGRQLLDVVHGRQAALADQLERCGTQRSRAAALQCLWARCRVVRPSIEQGKERLRVLRLHRSEEVPTVPAARRDSHARLSKASVGPRR